jgi:hypothetical protein
MFRRRLYIVAIVLAAPALTAQTNKPAIMHERMTTLSGCLQRQPDWVLTGATLAGQKEPATYRLEGIGEARLSVLVDKRVEATGAIVDAAKPPASHPAPGGKPAAGGTGQPLARFEAIAVREVAETCS